MKKIAVIVLGGILGLTFQIGTAHAVPIFARKYGTSCQTCHVAYPKLTPFGQAFKNNGLRWPGEDRNPDYEKKDVPVELGAKAYEKVWPKAVWPGEIPGFPPISFFLANQFESDLRDATANSKNQFQGFGSDLEFITAGTLGRHFAFWGDGAFELAVDKDTGDVSTDVGLGRAYLIVSPFKKPVFLAKIGRFEPHVAAVSVHRGLLGDYYLLTDQTIQDNGSTLEETQQGIELSGYPGGRLGYTVGVVEGSGNPLNNAKDFYARLEYKIGGLRSDGESDKDFSSTSPWRDDSITIGTFGYLGFAKLSNAAAVHSATDDSIDSIANGGPALPIPALVSQNDHFWIAGADLDINYANFLANIVYARQQNNQPLVGSSASASTNHLLGEVNWVAYPWLIPGVKYELFDSTGTRSQRITLGSNFLIRANIKAFLLGILEKVDAAGFGDHPAIQVGLVAGF